MVTKLNGQLRREIDVGGVAHVVTLTGDGLKLAEKGRRKGFELAWKDLVSGDAALSAALNAALQASPAPRPTRPGPAGRRSRVKAPRRKK